MRLFNRRQFGLSLVGASAAGLLSWQKAMATDPPPETTTIKLKKSLAICFAPYYVVEEFLLAEGFEDIRYIEAKDDAASQSLIQNGLVDVDQNFAGSVVHNLDTGAGITALGGLHVGCYEFFAHNPIRTISDLKGRRVGINGITDVSYSEYLYISLMAAYVGLDPKRDIEWVTGDRALEAFAAGETDAYLGFPPEPQMLRAQGHNRVFVNTGLDRPWSQYFCCVIYGNRTWVREHPIATKRYLRAIYRAAEMSTSQPESTARRLVDGGFTKRYDYALEAIKQIPYDLWHDYDVEDSMRFYALRMYDVGMLKSNPNTLIAQGSNWSFVNQLKREMKG